MCERGYLDWLGRGLVVVECQSDQPAIVHALYRNIIQPTGGGVSTKIIADALFPEIFNADRLAWEFVGIKWIRNDAVGKLIGGEGDIKRCKYRLELHGHGPIPLIAEIKGRTTRRTRSEVTGDTEHGQGFSSQAHCRAAVAGAGSPTRSDEQR